MAQMKNISVQHSESELPVSWHKHQWTESYSTSKKPPPLQEMKFFPGYKATIYIEENESMTGGTMINEVSYYGMRLGTMKQSYAVHFIAQMKKQNL